MSVKTTDPKDFSTLLEVFHIALTNGFMDKKEVVKWADEIIAKDEEPDYFIIELSLCESKSVNDIISLLNNYIGIEKKRLPSRAALGLLHNQYEDKQLSLQKICYCINWLAGTETLSPEENYFMYGLDDEYDLACDGLHGTIEEVEKEAMRFLRIYKDFRPDNFKDWNEINKTIDDKIRQLAEIVNKEDIGFQRMQAQNTNTKWWKFWQ